MRRFLRDIRPPVTGGFTLIEMLVACAVLMLMVVFIAQIISMSSNSISATSHRMDAMSEGRLVLDRIGTDLASRLRRSDVPVRFEKNSGNDRLTFYSEVPSYDGVRRASLVEYRIGTEPASREHILERGVAGTQWSGPTSVAFGQTAVPTIEMAGFDILSPGVLRLEYCYVGEDGKVSNTASDLTKVKAIVVGVAVLDEANRKITNSGDLDRITNDLSDVEEGKTPLETWQAAMSLDTFASGVPQKAKQNVRLFQRLYEVR
jgi:type II secretory pathway pseudopilin PulG